MKLNKTLKKSIDGIDKFLDIEEETPQCDKCHTITEENHITDGIKSWTIKYNTLCKKCANIISNSVAHEKSLLKNSQKRDHENTFLRKREPDIIKQQEKNKQWTSTTMKHKTEVDNGVMLGVKIAFGMFVVFPIAMALIGIFLFVGLLILGGLL